MVRKRPTRRVSKSKRRAARDCSKASRPGVMLSANRFVRVFTYGLLARLTRGHETVARTARTTLGVAERAGDQPTADLPRRLYVERRRCDGGQCLIHQMR